jgi:CHAT domain-containing protein
MADPAATARTWTESLVAAVMRPLRERTEAQLATIPWIARFPAPELAAAALMIRLASRYAAGERPDELIESLRQSCTELDGAQAREDARGLVLVARLMVHSAMLPDPRWWEPLLLVEHLALACAREATANGDDPAEILGYLELPDWVVERVLEAVPHVPGFGLDGAPELAEEAIEQVRAMTPEAAEERPDLVLGAAHQRRLMDAFERARATGDEELSDSLILEAERFGEAAAGLSLLELDLMREVEEDERLLIEAAAVAKRTITLSPEGEPTALTDLIDGRRDIPRALELYLGLSGQSFQQRIGLIVSWTVTFERVLPDGLEDDGPGRLGLGFPSEVDTEFLIEMTYGEEAVEAPLYYSPDSATATLSLAVLALTRCARIDFFLQTSSRAIRHAEQVGIVLPDEFHQKVFERAVSRCRALMVGGADGVMEALRAEHSGEEAPVTAFEMNESGKSEQLIDLRSPGAALGPFRQATPDQETELAGARRKLLLAEARRIEEPGKASEKAAGVEGAEYVAMVQRSRGEEPRERAKRSREEFDEAIGALVPAGGAIMHLTIDHRGLELAWADRAGGEMNIELLPCEDVDLDRLAVALAEPENGSVASLDLPHGPGLALGRRLRDQVAARGVDRLLVCSTRDLHGLPIHALRHSADTDERLLDLAQVVYSPSATIAAGLVRTVPRVGPKLVVGAAGLRYAEGEAALVAAATDAELVLVGDRATPAAFLAGLDRCSWAHIASHGAYRPDDHLASGLLLPTSDGEGALNVARILAEADLEGIDLAVLGACQTGAGQTAPSTLDVAGGIDTAFLAAGVRNVVSALWEIEDFGAILFHGELYRNLAAGSDLNESHRKATDLLRSGSWRQVGELPLGALLAAAGIDLDVAFAELRHRREAGDPVDFADLRHWAPYRLCGAGDLQDPCRIARQDT